MLRPTLALTTVAWTALALCMLSGISLAQQSGGSKASRYPLEAVLERSLPPAEFTTPESSTLTSIDPLSLTEPTNSAVEPYGMAPRQPWTDGMSPSHWGEPASVDSQEMPLPQDPAMSLYADPPAVVPELSAYQVRKAEMESKQSPKLREILNKGRYFAAVEALWMEPHFLGSTAMTQTTGTSVIAQPFDFGFSFSPRMTVGFESELGPGLEIKYWNYNGESDFVNFTSDGTTIGQTNLYLMGPERWTRITADVAGESLTVGYELEAQSLDIEFFKEFPHKVSRLNGILGLQYATISHRMRAELTDGGGAVLGELEGFSEFEGFGPKIAIEYFRPIGHTKLELLGGIQVTMLVGERDQLAENTSTLDFNLFAADELLSGLVGHLGVQYMHHLTEHRTLFARTTLEAQHWIGGGTATNPMSDFGLYGLTFGFGLNR